MLTSRVALHARKLPIAGQSSWHQRQSRSVNIAALFFAHFLECFVNMACGKKFICSLAIRTVSPISTSFARFTAPIPPPRPPASAAVPYLSLFSIAQSSIASLSRCLKGGAWSRDWLNVSFSCRWLTPQFNLISSPVLFCLGNSRRVARRPPASCYCH